MATTLGGVTLAEPAYGHDGYRRSVINVGARHELLSGSIAFDYVGYRRRYALHWTGITATERQAIFTQAIYSGTQAFSPPDAAGTTTVIVVPGSYRDSYIEAGDGTPYYDVELELEQTNVVT